MGHPGREELSEEALEALRSVGAKIKAHLVAGEGFWIPSSLSDGSLVNFETLLSQLGTVPDEVTAPYHIGNAHKLRADPNAEIDLSPGEVAADEPCDHVLAVLGEMIEGKSPVARFAL